MGSFFKTFAESKSGNFNHQVNVGVPGLPVFTYFTCPPGRYAFLFLTSVEIGIIGGDGSACEFQFFSSGRPSDRFSIITNGSKTVSNQVYGMLVLGPGESFQGQARNNNHFYYVSGFFRVFESHLSAP